MSTKPPTRAMRENPDIEQLKRQAKELLDAYCASSPDAVAEVTAWHRAASPQTFALHDAQFVLARSYGFESWPKLKAAVDGVTAARLHEAVERGDLAATRELLTRRPEIVDSARGEMRALHMAVLRRDLEMTRLLVEFGADPDGGIWPKRDATGPYTMASERGFDEIAAVLRAAREKRGARGSEGPSEAKRKLRQAWLADSEEAVVAVFEEHPELADIRTPDGVTPLHRMAVLAKPLVMKWLIDHGANVNSKPQTPLDAAAASAGGEWVFNKEKFAITAEFLLEHGAELSPLSAATLGRWDYLAAFSMQDLEARGILEAAVKGDQPDVVRRLLDLGLDPDEPTPVDDPSSQTWSAGGPLFQAIILNRIELARLLLERGANPNAQVWCSGSPSYRAYCSGDSALIALIEQYGGWIDAGSAGYARQIEIARRMLAGELDPHLEPNDFSGRTVAEQLLWGGASSLCDDIVRMALERVDWLPDDPRWFGMLLRPTWNNAHRPECCDTFKLILARSGPHHRAADYGFTMLHDVASDDHKVGVQLATILLDAGARLDIRDDLLKSTPLGWACRWGRLEMVKLLLARGADPVEQDAEPWARPRAWAMKMEHPQILGLLDEAIAALPLPRYPPGN